MKKNRNLWQCAIETFEEQLRKQDIGFRELCGAIEKYMKENNFPERSRTFPVQTLLKSRKIGYNIITNLTMAFEQGQQFPYTALSKDELVYKIAQQTATGILVKLNLGCPIDRDKKYKSSQ